MRRCTFLSWQILIGLLLLCAESLAQPVFTIQNVKNSCDGLANGSFEILVSSANNPPLDANVFGPPNQGPFALTVGVPFTVSNLPGSLAGRNYIVIVQDADGSTVLNTTIFNTPVDLSASLASSTQNSDCLTPNGTIDVNVSGGTGSYTFQWTGPPGFVDPATEDLSGLGAGSYSLTVFDDNTNCTRNVGPVVITDPLPTPFNVSSPTPSVCLGDPGTVRLANSEGATVIYEIYQDGNPTGITLAGANGQLDFLIPAGSLTPTGTYNFTIEAVNGVCAPVFMNGAASITVNPLPTAVTSGGGTICQGDVLPDVTFTFTGTAPFDFTYFDGTSSTNVVGHATTTFTLINAPVGTYSVTALTDANTCVATSFGSTVSVVENPLPTAVPSGGGTICQGDVLPDVTFTFTGAAPFDFTYFDGTSSTNVVGHATTTFTLVGAPIGTYSVTALTDANTCVGTSFGGTIVVTENPLPTAVTSGGGTICQGDVLPDVTFTFTGTAPFDFTYFDGTSSTNVVGHATTTFTLVNAPVGTYSVTALTDANTCMATSFGATVSVIENPLPTAVPSGGGTICQGDVLPDVVFTFTGTAPFDFTYFDGTGSTNVVGHATATFTIVKAPVGTYSVTALTDANTCIGTSFGVAVAVVENPLPTAVTSGGGTICQGDVLPDVTFTFTGTAPFDFTYFDGTSSTNVVGHATTTFTLVNAPVGTYSVTALTDANTCMATSFGATVSIIENPLPTAVPSGGGTICQGDVLPDVTFTFTGTAPFDFTYFDGTSSTNVVGHATTTFTLVGAPIGTYSVTALTDANTCVGTSFGGTVAVTENPRPTITLGANPTVCTGTPSTTISYSATTDAPDQFRIDWDAAAEAAGLVDVPATALPAGMVTITNVPINGGTYNGSLFVINSGTTCESIGDPISVTVQQDVATISGDATVCGGTSSPITLNFIGPGPTWNFTYTDGSSNFNLVAGANPFTFNVTPIISTTYTLVSVTGATCGAGVVNGSATVTLSPIAGNPATFGNETWLGYVYDDSGSPAPPATNIDYNNTKYRGFINDTEIASASAFSNYNATTDAFNLNLTNSIPIAGPNICGSYLNDFSVRYRMTKTFAAGIYTFTVGSDDGVRLLVDGVSVLPAGAFNTHAFTTYTSAPQCLTAGTHNLVIEYFDRGGFSRIDFNYSAAPPPVVATPVSVCVNSPTPTLTASSPGAIDYNWYTDVALTNPPIFSGANYIPAASELDMTIAGTTDFFVTAVYACGETPAAQVTVDITNGATINLPAPPVQVCDVGGMVDLTTLVSATPIGGAFTFSGTGVTVSPMFDPTLVAGTTTISVDYTSGTCMASTTFDIDVVSNATIMVPGAATACESAGFLDLNTIVSGSPIGGVFTFVGAGVTGSTFDPTGLSGAVSITVDYAVGGCNAPTQMFDLTVVPNITMTPALGTTACPADPPLDLISLLAFNPTGGVLTFSGPGVTGNSFDPSTSAGTTANISADYDLGGCLASATIQIVVRAIGDPACGGPTGNCASVVITPVPSPAICSPTDGSVMFNINPATPAVNNTGVTINIVGASASNQGFSRTNFNDPLFTALPVGTYDFSIEYGDPGCIKTGQVTVLLGPDVVDFNTSSNGANCFGSSGGVLLSNINGSDLADYTYEVFQLGAVVATGTITQIESLTDVTLTGFGLGDFEIKLSQDQSATTTCANPVQSARKPFTVIGATAGLDTLYVTKTISVPDLPTGSMLVGVSESLQEPYEVRLELVKPVFPGQVFAQDFTPIDRNPLSLKFEFDAPNIYAGEYMLSLRDALDCRKDYVVNIGLDTSLSIPNVFTPNGDGVNEVFFIRNIPESTSIVITNRWGNEVFSSTNYENNWNGGSVEDGVYFYRVSTPSNSYSGWVEVMRGQ